MRVIRIEIEEEITTGERRMISIDALVERFPIAHVRQVVHDDADIDCARQVAATAIARHLARMPREDT